MRAGAARVVETARVLLADAHNDLVLELVLRGAEERPFERYWLPPLDSGGVSLQVCPLYAADKGAGEARPTALGQVEALRRALEETRGRTFQVDDAADLDRLGDGRIGLMLSMEGVEPLEGDPDAFETWWRLGVRMVGLTWNHANAFAGGVESPERGLTDRGRELLGTLEELGVVLDLAHASERTWHGVLDRWRGEVVVSHAGCRAVHDHVRNLSDDQLRALAAGGGVLGMMALALVVDPEAPTLDRWVDHVDHAVSVMGIDHVCLGADFIDQVAAAELAAGRQFDGMMEDAQEAGGGRFGLDGFTGPEHYDVAVEALRRRGYDGDELAAILHGNLLRVLRRALP